MAGIQTNLTKSFEINGINARDWGVELIGIEGRGLPAEVRAREFSFPDEGGAPRQYGDLPGTPIHRLTGYVVGDDAPDCRIKYGKFLQQVGLPVDIEQQLLIRSIEGQYLQIRYLDEPHKTWKALYAGGSTRRELRREQWRIGRFIFYTLEFKIPDVYAYGDEVKRTLDLSSDQFISLPTGTAPSRPRLHYRNNTVSNVTTLDMVGGRYALNTPFDNMDTNGYPKGRGIKNDQNFTGDYDKVDYVTGILSQAAALYKLPGEDYGPNLSFYNKTDESSPGANEPPVFGSSDRLNPNQGTISFWVNTAWNGDDGISHYFMRSAYDSSNCIQFAKHNSNVLRFIVNNVTVDTSALTSTTWASGTWHWVAVRWNTRTAGDGDIEGSDYVELFLDAIAEVASSSSNPAEATQVAQISYIGCYDSDGQHPLDGIIDEFAIWDRVLTDAELTTIFNSGTGARADNVSNGLLTYFDFDGSGSLTEGTNAGLGSQSSVTMNASSYTQGTKTLAFAGNASDVFKTGDRVVVWSSGATNKYDDIVASSTSTTVVLTTGGAMTLTTTIHVSKNLLANSEFEHTNAADYWTAGTNITLATETTIVKKDSQALKISNTFTGGEAGVEWGQSVDEWRRTNSTSQTLTIAEMGIKWHQTADRWQAVGLDNNTFSAWIYTPSASTYVNANPLVVLGQYAFTVAQALGAGFTGDDAWHYIEYGVHELGLTYRAQLFTGSNTDADYVVWDM